MHYQLTVRWGQPSPRFFQAAVQAPDLRSALAAAAEALPDDVAATADLAELRPAPDPEARSYTEG